MVIKFTIDDREKLSIQFIRDILSYRFRISYIAMFVRRYTLIVLHVTFVYILLCIYIITYIAKGKRILYSIDYHVISKLNVR